MSLVVLKTDLLVYKALSKLSRLAREEILDTKNIGVDTENIGVGRTGQKGITRDGLVELTGFSRTTIYDSLVRLDLKELIKNFSEKREKRGRPKEFFRLI